jgi:hypothetical protein
MRWIAKNQSDAYSTMLTRQGSTMAEEIRFGFG